MKRWAIIGLAAAVCGLLGHLVWQLRDRPASEDAIGVQPEPTPRPDRPTSAVRPTRSDRRAVSSAVQRPLAPSPGTDQSRLFLGDGAMQELLSEAATCYRDEPGRDEEMTINFLLRVRSGIARISRVEIARRGLGSSRLEDCIAQALDEHSWPVPAMPDLEEWMDGESITILGLRKRQPPRP